MRRSFLTGLIVVMAVALPALAAMAYYRQAAPVVAPLEGPLGAAVAHLEQAIALEPQNAESYRYLSAAYRLQDRLAEAETVWQRALEANPGQSWPIVELGNMYEEAGLPLKARAAYFRAADLNPEDATANQKLERSAAAVAGLKAMQAYAAEQTARGSAELRSEQVVLINQALANGWTYLGYIADQAALSAGETTTLRSFWRAPAVDTKPVLQPETWLPAGQDIWMSTAEVTNLLPGALIAGATGNEPQAFPDDLYGAAPGTRQLQRVARGESEITAGALVNDPANRNTSFVGKWQEPVRSMAYVVSANVFNQGGNPAVGWQWRGDIPAAYGPSERYAQVVGRADGWQQYAGLAAPLPGADSLRMVLLNTATTGMAMFADAILAPTPLPAPLYAQAGSGAQERQVAWAALQAQLLHYPNMMRQPAWQEAVASLGPLVPVKQVIEGGWTVTGYSTDEEQLARGAPTPLVLFWQGPPGATAGTVEEGWIDLQSGNWLQVLPKATNAIPSGDFESGLEPWAEDRSGAPAETQSLTVTVRNGFTTTAAALTNSTAYTGTSLLSALQPVAPNSIFVQSGWLRGETGRGSMGRQWYGEFPPEQTRESYITLDQNPSEWTHYAGVAEPLPGSAQVQIWLLNYQSEGVTFFDDIILAPVPAPHLTNTLTSTLTGTLTSTLTVDPAVGVTDGPSLMPTSALTPAEQARLYIIQYWSNPTLVNDENWLTQVADTGPAYLLDQDANRDWTLYGYTTDEEALAAGATRPVFYFWQGPADAIPGNRTTGWYSLGIGYWLQIDGAAANLLANGDLEGPIEVAAFPLDESTGQSAPQRLATLDRDGYVTTAVVLASAASADTASVVSPALPVDRTKQYLQVGRLRAENGGRGQLGVQWLGSEGISAGQDRRWIAFNAANTSWQQVAGLLAPPLEVASMRVVARNSAMEGAVMLDDLILLPVSLPTASATPAPSPTATLSPTATATSTPIVTPTRAATATATRAPTATATRTTSATATRTLTAMVTPGPTPLSAVAAVSGGLRVNVRSTPDLAAEVIASLEENAAITVLARTGAGDWLQVQAADGTVGWVSTELVGLNAPIDRLPVSGN